MSRESFQFCATRSKLTLVRFVRSWEQIGQWGQAQVLHESAQITARSGVMPFTESELALWEDHWIITAQKLQQVSLSPRAHFLSLP